MLGVELSRIAVEEFFAEHGLDPEVSQSRYGIALPRRRHRADLRRCVRARRGRAGRLHGGVRPRRPDRPAAPLRRRYVDELYPRLPAGCRGLLITLEYPQHEKDGPPFSVVEDEVRELYGRDWDVATLERRDILAQQPKFIEEGVSALETVVYRIECRDVRAAGRA